MCTGRFRDVDAKPLGESARRLREERVALFADQHLNRHVPRLRDTTVEELMAGRPEVEE